MYGLTYKRRGIPMRLIIPFMKKWSSEANKLLEDEKDFFSKQSSPGEEQKPGIIVSLTSFPARIKDVWKTIASIKRQTCQPEKIILWLSKDEFPEEKLPDVLENMQDNLFQVRFVEGNVGSHKKYLYAFKEFADHTIVTLDDDMFYHKDVLKCLVDVSEKNRGKIIANRVRRIPVNDGPLSPYKKWKVKNLNPDDPDLIQIGVDGVLYPPGSLHREAFNSEIFMQLTPYADDVWLNAMARLNGTHVVYSGWKYRNIPVAEDSPSLEQINCEKGRNDIQIKELRRYIKTKFGKDIYSK